MSDVADRVAVVTGAGGTIGRPVVLELARRGAAVLAVDRDRGAAEETARHVTQEGLTCIAHEADVADETAVAGYVDEAMRRWGRIDWFANNAAIEGPAASITEFPADGFRQVMEVNVVGVFLGMKHVLSVMRDAGGGRIVNSASVAGLFGTPQVIAYGASKHAVIGMTRTAAVEFAADHIAVNAICPGPQEGRMMDAIEGNVAPDDPAGARAAYVAAIPMGRYGDPSEIAQTVAWLLTDAPPYLTGQTIVVDGGFLIA